MTSVILDIRNFASVKRFNNLFHTNQDVSVTFSSGIVTVTSMQNGSTPGIILNKQLYLEPETTYEFIVLGRTSAGVMLWAYDKTNNVLLNDGTQRISDDTSANNMFITNRNSRRIKVRLGILFEKPAEVGDQFTLEAVALIKRSGTVNGLWRVFEHEDLVIRDKYSINDSRWVPTVTYTNTE